MKSLSFLNAQVLSAMGAVLLSYHCAGATEPVGPTPATATNEIASTAEGVKPAPASVRPLPADAQDEVSQVLQMLQAGVSKDVVKAYVESSPVAYQLSAADLIKLKQYSVPDDITTAMLKRGLELRETRSGVAQTDAGAESVSNARLRSARRGGVDPESYDFWWYHYAYPRALAYANRQFMRSTQPYQWPYYYYPAIPYWPQPPLRWQPSH